MKISLVLLALKGNKGAQTTLINWVYVWLKKVIIVNGCWVRFQWIKRKTLNSDKDLLSFLSSAELCCKFVLKHFILKANDNKSIGGRWLNFSTKETKRRKLWPPTERLMPPNGIDFKQHTHFNHLPSSTTTVRATGCLVRCRCCWRKFPSWVKCEHI